MASPWFFDREVWLILLFPRLIKLMSGILQDVGTSIKTRDTNMIKIQISNRRTKLCCVGIRESHPSFYPPPPQKKRLPCPFFSRSPNKTPLYGEVSKTTNIRYNKYNHTAWLVYRTLFGLPSKGCLNFMHSLTRSWNKKIALISFVQFSKIITSLRSARFVGRGRRAQNKRSIPLESLRLADSRNVSFFENLPTPFFGNVGFVKFSTFSALLALPVMIREEYGQMAHQTLPNILLSNASLVTKSCIARFVEGDAFSPSALSDCSTGPSPQLAHAKSTLSPSQASAGCPRAGLFCRFRSICEQTAHRSWKIRAQCERPPIHVL